MSDQAATAPTVSSVVEGVARKAVGAPAVQPFRLAAGGAVDRSRPVSFRFDGRPLTGYAGDTLASALLANGVRLVGRSFKYHRPRGILSAGSEEPNALVELREGARREPNTRATMVELYDGLTAASQNRFPSLAVDLMAVNGLLSPVFSAGFYYKTFMWPASGWMVYEWFIRRAAGLGTASTEPDPDRYEKLHAFCDVLVVGGGPAGLAAARAAAETGARVILCDEHAAFGGSLRLDRERLDDQPAMDWVRDQEAALGAMPEVTLLPRTTAFGYYDGNTLGLVERVADHLPLPGAFQPRQRLWTVRAGRVVLATGALERPLVFGDNDRPGVMLASAVRGYVNRWAVLPGRRAVVATNNDSAYATAFDLADAGATVEAIVDARPTPPDGLVGQAKHRGIEVLTGHAVVRALGGQKVKAIDVGPLDGDGSAVAVRRRFRADLVAMSGGWSPTVHLQSQSGAKPTFDPASQAFLPGLPRQAQASVGSCAGAWTLAECLEAGAREGSLAAAATGFAGTSAAVKLPRAEPAEARAPIQALWDAKAADGKPGKRFVDFQNDVTASDVALAQREGYASVEHMKRYTTLGMATDQGKSSNVNGLAILARERGEPIERVGTTTFRPPFTPVAMGVFGGRETGRHFRPIRRTPMHDWHARNGAVFVETGPWLRPRYYPKPGETIKQAYSREAAHVRAKVGMADVSTLGKIAVQGPDAAEFLNRVYVNGWSKLAVGRARYGVMLRDDGLAFDDGTTARLSEHEFYMTTTTANAAPVLATLEKYLQLDWPDLKVHVTSVTEQWAQMAVAGPHSRDVLRAGVTGIDLSNDGLPFMGVAQGTIAGMPVRVFRISFSGELAYEVATPANHGTAVWEALMSVGRSFDIMPYGLESMGTLRIEKGHVAGPELDGRRTLDDLGLGRMASSRKWFIGQQMMQRPAMTDPDRPKLVGLVSVDRSVPLRGGAQLVEGASPSDPGPMLGHVTSTTWSPALGEHIALGFVQGGVARDGQTLYAAFPLRDLHTPVRVVRPHFYDPNGERLDG